MFGRPLRADGFFGKQLFPSQQGHQGDAAQSGAAEAQKVPAI
jgi:hypothetical protein